LVVSSSKPRDGDGSTAKSDFLSLGHWTPDGGGRAPTFALVLASNQGPDPNVMAMRHVCDAVSPQRALRHVLLLPPEVPITTVNGTSIGDGHSFSGVGRPITGMWHDSVLIFSAELGRSGNFFSNLPRQLSVCSTAAASRTATE
jgi:hypothetical protein